MYSSQLKIFIKVADIGSFLKAEETIFLKLQIYKIEIRGVLEVMEKIKEEVPEKLRIAVLLSFISGYINAFTYNNAGELFAGAQTGNVIFIK